MVQHRFLALRIQFEYAAPECCLAKQKVASRGAIKIPRSVPNQPAPRVPLLLLLVEAVQNSLPASRADLEYRAAAGAKIITSRISAIVGGAIEVSSGTWNQASIRESPVGRCQEPVDDGLLAGFTYLEHRAAASLARSATTSDGSAKEVALAVPEQSREWGRSVGQAGKLMEHRLVAFLIHLKHCASASIRSPIGGAVEVAGFVSN